MRKQRTPNCGITNRSQLSFSRPKRILSSFYSDSNRLVAKDKTDKRQLSFVQTVKEEKPSFYLPSSKQNPSSEITYSIYNCDSSRLEKIHRDKVKLLNVMRRRVDQDKFQQTLQQKFPTGKATRTQLQSLIRSLVPNNFSSYEVNNFMSYFMYDHENKLHLGPVSHQLYHQNQLEFFERAGQRRRLPAPSNSQEVEQPDSLKLAKLLEEKRYLSNFRSSNLFSKLDSQKKGFVTGQQLKNRLVAYNYVNQKDIKQIVPNQNEIFMFNDLVKRLKPSDLVYSKNTHNLTQTGFNFSSLKKTFVEELRTQDKDFGRGKYSNTPAHKNTFQWMRPNNQFNQKRQLNQQGQNRKIQFQRKQQTKQSQIYQSRLKSISGYREQSQRLLAEREQSQRKRVTSNLSRLSAIKEQYQKSVRK